MNKKQLIFDFDGTIVDSLTIVFDVMNELSSKFNFKRVSKADLPILKSMSAKDILAYLGVKTWQVPLLMMTVRRQLKKNMLNMSVQEGLLPIFAKIPDCFASCGILSSNSQKNIQTFLESKEIGCFNYVQTEKFRLSKYHALNKLITKRNFKITDTCYVADEVRDIEAAKKAGITTIAVSWGYNSKEILSKAQPDFLVESASQLENALMCFKEIN
jgi:phosphoglycolate phosphatase